MFNLPGNIPSPSYVFTFNPRTSFSRKQVLSASPYFQKNASPRRLTRKFFRYLHNYAVTYRIAQSPGHYGKKYPASDAQGTTFSDGSFARRHGIMTRSIRFCPTSSLCCFLLLLSPSYTVAEQPAFFSIPPFFLSHLSHTHQWLPPAFPIPSISEQNGAQHKSEAEPISLLTVIVHPGTFAPLQKQRATPAVMLSNFLPPGMRCNFEHFIFRTYSGVN